MVPRSAHQDALVDDEEESIALIVCVVVVQVGWVLRDR